MQRVEQAHVLEPEALRLVERQPDLLVLPRGQMRPDLHCHILRTVADLREMARGRETRRVSDCNAFRFETRAFADNKDLIT